MKSPKGIWTEYPTTEMRMDYAEHEDALRHLNPAVCKLRDEMRVREQVERAFEARIEFIEVCILVGAAAILILALLILVAFVAWAIILSI